LPICVLVLTLYLSLFA